MIKGFRGLAVATIASSAFLATGAWAALNQSTNDATMAASLFGEGSDAITFTPTGAAVVINTTTDIGANNIADLTITLDNAVFGAVVSPSDITIPGVPGVSFSLTNGGQIDDGFVTFTANTLTTVVPAASNIVFEIPALTGADLTGPLDVVEAVSTIVSTTASANPFPDEIETNDCDNPTDCQIVDTASPYDPFEISSGDNGGVDIDNRTEIANGGSTLFPDDDGGDSVEGLFLGSHVLFDDGVLQRDGDGWDVDTGDGEGTITLTVGANFRSGDVVFIDLDGSSGPTASLGEVFTISGSTATSGPIPVDAAINNVFPIFFLPNDTDELAPETFSVSAAIDYNLATNKTDATLPQTDPATIEFNGIFEGGYAYGVVKRDGADVSFVRVTNELNSPASIFMSCTDDAGNSYFGDFGIQAAGTTKAYNSTVIGNTIGGTFTGRGACSILTDGDISVQHKIRTSDVLTDNSVVVGRDIDIQED